MYENDFIRMLGLISKFITSPTGKQIITIHILPNISRNKGNQTICQIISSIFIERIYAKCFGETSPTPLSKESTLSISLD